MQLFSFYYRPPCILCFVNLLLKLISFVRLEQLLQDLTGMFGERLVGTDLVAAESVVENIDSLARLVQNVVSRQVEVKGRCWEQVMISSTSNLLLPGSCSYSYLCTCKPQWRHASLFRNHRLNRSCQIAFALHSFSLVSLNRPMWQRCKCAYYESQSRRSDYYVNFVSIKANLPKSAVT